MNKKDVEQIGYLLSLYEERGIPGLEFWVEGFTSWDKRIVDKFESFRFLAERDERIMERYEELLTEKYGPNWCFLKQTPERKAEFKRFFEQAKSENPL